MTKSDYKFVTGLSDLDFSHGIMPLRVGNHDERWVIGEDVAFLAEAAAEMKHVLGVEMNWHYGDGVDFSMKDRRILAWRPYAIAKAFKSATNTNYRIMTNGDPLAGYENYWVTVYSSTTQEGDWTFQSHPEFWNSVKVGAAWESNPDAFKSGSPVEYAPIMQMFRDSQRVKSVARLDVGSLSASGETWNITHGGHAYDPTPSSGLIRAHEAVDWGWTPYAHMTGWGHADISGGVYVTPAVKTYGIPLSARVYVAIKTQWYITSQSSPEAREQTTKGYHIDVARLNAVRDGGGFRISASQLLSLCNELQVAHGISEIHPEAASSVVRGNSVSMRINLLNSCVQLVRGDHTIYHAPATISTT